MGSIIGALLKWLLGRFFPGTKAPEIQDIAASNATAQAVATQEKAANEVVTKASTARADAADDVVRVIAEQKPGATNASVNAALKQRFPEDFRD